MGVASIVKILLGIVIFFMILYEAREREIFYKMVSWALVMPNLLMIPLLFFPEIAERFGMLSEGYRFQGLTVNPGLFGLLAVIAFSFVCSFLFNTLRKKEPLHILVLHAFFLVGIGALVFWSQSRSYIIMLYFIPVITGFWYWGFIGMKLSKTIWSSVLAIILICGSFFFMPSLARNLLVNVRLFGAQESTDVIKLAKNPSGEQPTHSELLTRESLQTAKTIIAEDPRLTMWSYYLPLFPKYPLGWGANYQPKFAFPWHYNSSVSFLPPIFIFNVWAIGGVVALISLILLSWEALIQFRRQLTDRANTLTPYAAGTATAFSMFWITSVFNGFPIEYLCFWIILALLLSDINPKPLPPDYGTYAR